MKYCIKPQFLAASLGLLGLFACDLSDSTVSAESSSFTSIAPRIVAANGSKIKTTGYVRIGITIPSTGLTRDTIYPFGERRGKVTGIPVGAQLQISVVGFDSVANASGQVEVVNRWSGVTSATAKAVTANMDSATVAATQPVVVAQAPEEVRADLSALPAMLAAAGGTVDLPTASALGLNSSQEYRYAVDAGDESKIVSVSAGSPKVPDDGKVSVTATSWVKVRVFVRDQASGLMLGTDGDSALVHVPAPRPELLGLEGGDGRVVLRWQPLSAGRIEVVARGEGDTAWKAVRVDGSLGRDTLRGFANGKAVEVKFRTVWGPAEGRDTSVFVVAGSVIPRGAAPKVFGAGTWYGISRVVDTAMVGDVSRGSITLKTDGTFLKTWVNYRPDWNAKSWIPSRYPLQGMEAAKGYWAYDGNQLHIRQPQCGIQMDTGFVLDTLWTESGCLDTLYSVLAEGDHFSIVPQTRHDMVVEAATTSLPALPTWDYPEDHQAPEFKLPGIVGDTIWCKLDKDTTLSLLLTDSASGLDSIHVAGAGFWMYEPNAGFSMSDWCPTSVSWLGLTVRPKFGVVTPVDLWLRDMAGSIDTKRIYVATKATQPSWKRISPLGDTIRIAKGDSVQLKAKLANGYTKGFAYIVHSDTSGIWWLDQNSATVDSSGMISFTIRPDSLPQLRIIQIGDTLNSYRQIDSLWIVPQSALQPATSGSEAQTAMLSGFAQRDRSTPLPREEMRNSMYCATLWRRFDTEGGAQT